jgi:hypothetical protein
MSVPARCVRLLALPTALLLAACDMPIGNPSRDAEGVPVVDAKSTLSSQVIVRLRFDAPDGASPDSEAYRTALVAVREKFISELGAMPHRVVRTYDVMPLVVLALAPSDRPALEKLPSVASVEEDRLNAPLAR